MCWPVFAGRADVLSAGMADTRIWRVLGVVRLLETVKRPAIQASARLLPDGVSGEPVGSVQMRPMTGAGRPVSLTPGYVGNA